MSIRKAIVLVLITTVIVSGIFIACYKFSSKSSQSPKILLSEEEWDFGIVKPNEKPTHIFILKNEGAETVKIISIKSSADYIAPLRSELSLKSREEQDLQVVLLKDKAREEIKENKTEEYLYLTIAIPIKISK